MKSLLSSMRRCKVAISDEKLAIKAGAWAFGTTLLVTLCFGIVLIFSWKCLAAIILGIALVVLTFFVLLIMFAVIFERKERKR